MIEGERNAPPSHCKQRIGPGLDGAPFVVDERVPALWHVLVGRLVANPLLELLLAQLGLLLVLWKYASI